jgi:hypothetical protein
MNDERSAEMLSYARSAVLRAIHAAGPDSPGSAIDEDTLMRVVPWLERHDHAWLRETLADEGLSLEGRKEIHSYTEDVPAPWSEEEPGS